MSNSNIIPATVPGLGPMFQRLPMELLFEIFKVILADIRYQGTFIDKSDFDRIFDMGIKNIASVSKEFSILVFQDFYKREYLNFLCTGTYRKASRFGTTMPPDMPAPRLRHLLRRIRVEFVLEDTYLARQPGVYNGVKRMPITTGNDLLRFCSGVASLSTLTDALTGFSHLEALDINIIVDVRGCRKTAVKVFKEAAISVRADWVTVSIKNRQGIPESWYGGLDHAITRA
jgi:hypothetical protein